MRRTAAVNQNRSLLLDRGVTLRNGRKYVDQRLSGILDAHLRLSGALGTLLAQLKLELDQLPERIAKMDRVIQQTTGEYEGCRRMLAIPGIGPVTATGIVAAVGSGHTFGKGRDFAAWIDLVPTEYSTRANNACSASANVAIVICENGSSRALVQFCKCTASSRPA
jgi:transposase